MAKKVGVSQPAIAQIESGRCEPTQDVLQSIALNTGFEVRFFRNESEPIEFPIGSLLYRAGSKVSKRDRALAHRLAQTMFGVVTEMMGRLRDIPILLPRISHEPPERAAQMTRAALGLSPDTPVANLTSALERAGVLIFALPMECEGFDGSSAWVNTPASHRPVISLIGGKRGFRLRSTLGEETGHLVLHSPLVGSAKSADEEARKFAAELLLPAEAMKREMIEPITLTTIAGLKPRWQVSMQFLVRRAFDLNRVTANQYRYLNQQIAARGWKTQEPNDDLIVQEQPRAFRKMIEVLYGAPPDYVKIKRDTGIPVSVLRGVIEAHATFPRTPELDIQPRESARVIQFRR